MTIAERNNRQRRRAQGRLSQIPERKCDESIVCLVGCGKSKLESAATVRDLYTSPLFKKSVELAELIAPRATYVVSASRKAPLSLDGWMVPYDRKLSARDAPEWAAWMVSGILLHTMHTAPSIRVVLFMGETYARPLIREIEARRRKLTMWRAPVDLLQGLQIGDRLSFLNLAIKKLKEGER